MSDKQLIQQFIDSYKRLDDLFSLEAAPPELRPEQNLDEWDRWEEDLSLWEPRRINTPPDRLEPLYSRIAGQFPMMYEELVLSYRWLEVDLKVIRLFANPPGPDFKGLAEEIFQDPIIAEVLIPAGFVPFGRSSINYDPMCFDFNHLTLKRDCPIVQFEHESILRDLKIGKHWQRWESFRDLMTEVIFLDTE